MSISRLLLSILTAVIAAVALYAGVFFAKKQFDSNDITHPSRYLSLKDYLGNEHAYTQWQGKVLLINFWATWCGPCREEMPMLADFQARYGDEGLQIIGIAIDDPEPVQLFADSMGINYPLLMADDSTTEFMQQYNKVGAIPFSLMTDRQGIVQETKLGVFTADELIAMLEPLLN